MKLITLLILLARVAMPAYATTVPQSSVDGQYVISWDAVATVDVGSSVVDPTDVSYILQESTSPLFVTVSNVPLVNPHATAVMLTGRTPGIYYYRVKAQHPLYQDSGWTMGSNGCRVRAAQRLVGIF